MCLLTKGGGRGHLNEYTVMPSVYKESGGNRRHTFSLDREIAVWASWGLHPAEPFTVW